MNLEKYNELVKFRSISYSKEQDYLILYLKEYLKNLKFDTYIDVYGNLIAERGKGSRPLIIAHVDINQESEYIPSLIRINDYLIGFFEGEQIGVGHDDKVGIYFALKFAEETNKPLTIIFTKDEEVGCIGTLNLSYDFRDINLAVQLDRRGASDISDYTNGVSTVSKQFKEICKPYLKEHNFKFTRTIYTDVGELKASHKVNFCCVNISCGYYNEHSNQEFLKISEFNNSYNFASKLLINLGHEKQEHKFEQETFMNTYFKKSYSKQERKFYLQFDKHYNL